MESLFPLYLTFDDILIMPNYSEVLPHEVDIQTKLTRRISMKIPIISAAMDTVTEADMAIELAKMGGIGIIHRNLTIQEQVREVEKVKKYSSWIITSPVFVDEETTVGEAIEKMREKNISGLPVVKNGYLVGIVTSRDLRFESTKSKKIKEVMKPKEKLIVVKEEDKISPEKAKEIMHEHKIEKLPIVDSEFRLKGLITLKDISKSEENPNALKDSSGHLVVGAAIGTGEKELERAEQLIKAGVDVLVIDSAHGHSRWVIETLKKIKEKFDIDVIAGNVATQDGTKALLEAGADAIKVGVGPGSICTTRIVSGVGVPQISAILECSKLTQKYGVPLVADGGIRYPGDIVKALVVGADSVMLGNMLAGTDEAPGEKVLKDGRPYKVYRGMGSEDAIKDGMQKGVRSRYLSQDDILPEGVVGLVPYKGTVRFIISNLMKSLQVAFGYIGAKNIKEARQKARVIRITEAGYKESHVHSVQVLKETFPFVEK